MKKYFILLAVVTLLMSCGKTEKPTVVTTDVLNVTEFTAICTGNVESDGGAEVTAKGVCWSKEQKRKRRYLIRRPVLRRTMEPAQ